MLFSVSNMSYDQVLIFPNKKNILVVCCKGGLAITLLVTANLLIASTSRPQPLIRAPCKNLHFPNLHTQSHTISDTVDLQNDKHKHIETITHYAKTVNPQAKASARSAKFSWPQNLLLSHPSATLLIGSFLFAESAFFHSSPFHTHSSCLWTHVSVSFGFWHKKNILNFQDCICQTESNHTQMTLLSTHLSPCTITLTQV